MFKWKEYNGALMPAGAPHIAPTEEDIERAKKMGGYRFITYVTDFDCEEETPWWYIIKDEPLVLEEIESSNTRHKIRKGLRHVEIRKIDCRAYGEELYNCYLKAQERYKAYENQVSREMFLEALEKDTSQYYGAFFRENNAMVAYVKIELFEDSVAMSVIKYDPEYLKYQVSAALTYQVVCDYLNEGHCKYVIDGQRAIRHKTNIQDYLEHTFQFRKAYCRLHMVYNTKMKIVVKVLYPFRKVVEKIAGENVFLNNVVSVLKMEEISRACRKKS